MQKLHRPIQNPQPGLADRPSAPSPATPGANAPEAASRAVRVHWGSLSESLDLAGMTVAEAHGLLRRPYHIAPEVHVTVNGVPPAPDQRLEVGDVLEFVRLAGEKGGPG